MKKMKLFLALLFFAGTLIAQVHTSYLWHMQQPNYWPEKSKEDPNRYQLVKESHDLKTSGDIWNVYSDGVSHPLNDLADIFGKYDRVNAYQHGPKNSVERLLSHPNGGAQVNYSGCLIENVNSLADANQWGYYGGWENNFTEAKEWTTSDGFPRMDMIGFTFHHALSPLISERALSKELQAHRYISTETFGGPYSKGYWPAECSFSERIIKVLVEEGIEWSVVANSHLARTLNDYQDDNYGTSGVNSDPPNAADKVATNGENWWGGQIDGRGGQFAAPYCYQAHKAKYVDPETGQEYKIDVVPMGDLLSYQNGYSSMGTGEIDSYIAPFSDPSQPSIVLMAHDGDNAWGGGDSYYQESVPNFADAAAAKGYDPTTIQQFLSSYPVPENDIVKVEDGSWVNADSDWGHPQFINWLWPMYDQTDYRFDPNGWTEDARNWAVITAAENFVIMAEDLAGQVDIAEVISPSASATNAEKAWHFFLPSLTSGYMYYGKSLDMEVKQTLAGNNAIEFAQSEISKHSGADNTAPSVFIPQRFPYNPGGKGFGPIYGYQEFDNSSDFHVWTFAYDVSRIQSAVLKYRTDNDGTNPLDDNVNDVYADGTGVSTWTSLNMTTKEFPKDNVSNDPEIDFFMLPTEIADLCYAEIRGLSDVLVDYYVEVTDSKGNVFKTPIQHVYVGEYRSSDKVALEITPPSGHYPSSISIDMSATTTSVNGGVNIYYTLDGSEPSNNSSAFTTPFSIGGTADQEIILKAIAIDADGNSSEIIERRYTFGEIQGYDIHFKNTSNWADVNIYLFDYASGSILNGWGWPGAAMTQEEDSPWYVYTIEETTEVGIVFNDNNGSQSVDLTRNYEGWYDFATSLWYDECPGDCPGVTPAPVLSVSPNGGTFENSVTVSLTATEGGTITYSLDGSAPNLVYTSPIEITNTTRLRAIATNDNGTSNEVDETYAITYPVPVLSVTPAGQDFVGSISVLLEATFAGIITYTLDGTDPKMGELYTGELNISEDAQLRAIAQNQNGYSNEINEVYTKVISQCDTIYYYNTNNWSAVNIYLFNANGSGISGWNWPGVSMTQVGSSLWYYYVNCEEGDVGIVFNDGAGNQESDQFENSGWFYNGDWYTSCPADCSGETPDGLTVYYNNNSTNWETVSLYFWSVTPSGQITGWPGVMMTDNDGDGWFEYLLEGAECANVIFSNNGASQTGDLRICGNGYYDDGWVNAPAELKVAKNEEAIDNKNNILSKPYPNPFTNKISFYISEEKEDARIIISDMKGAVVYSEIQSSETGYYELNLTVPSGLYFMQIIVNNSVKNYQILKQ